MAAKRSTWSEAERAAISGHMDLLKARYHVAAPVNFTGGSGIYHSALLLRDSLNRQFIEPTSHKFAFGSILGRKIMERGFVEYDKVRAQMPGLIPANNTVKGGQAMFWVVTHEFAHLLQGMTGERLKGDPHGSEFVAWYRVVLTDVPWAVVAHLYRSLDCQAPEPPFVEPRVRPVDVGARRVVSMAAGEVVEHKFVVNGATYLRVKRADGTYRLVKV